MLHSSFNSLTQTQKTVNLALLPSSWLMLVALRLLVAINQWSADRISNLVGEGEELPEIDEDF